MSDRAVDTTLLFAAQLSGRLVDTESIDEQGAAATAAAASEVRRVVPSSSPSPPCASSPSPSCASSPAMPTTTATTAAAAAAAPTATTTTTPTTTTAVTPTSAPPSSSSPSSALPLSTPSAAPPTAIVGATATATVTVTASATAAVDATTSSADDAAAIAAAAAAAAAVAPARSQRPLVVLKVGTSTMVRDTDSELAGEMALGTLASLVDTVAALRARGWGVVLVSSGAVGVGCRQMGLRARPTKAAEVQAMAAIGQLKVMESWRQLFAFVEQPVAQVLMNGGDVAMRENYFGARRTLLQLLELGVVPIVNENDSIVSRVARFGDNDRLSAVVASMLEARWLFLLTDVDQMYTADPRTDPDARPLFWVDAITDAHGRAAGEVADNAPALKGTGSGWGSGGMGTKVKAARLAVVAGVTCAIVHGQRPARVLEFVERGVARPHDADSERALLGTVFAAAPQPLTVLSKRWLVSSVDAEGAIVIDDGAVRAICERNKSLLPAGIVDVEGDFSDSDVVVVLDRTRRERARGIVSFSAAELREVMGHHTDEIDRLLKTTDHDIEVIHRDRLVRTKHLPDPERRHGVTAFALN